MLPRITDQSQFGHFLTYELWEDAYNLLRFQVKQRKSNRHFNTLSMFYYEQLLPDVELLREPSYFQDKVASSLFYGLEKEFNFLDYVIPKQLAGLRRYKFLMYPTRILYYAVGLYLLKLTDEFRHNVLLKDTHIKSYYGGNLILEKGRLLVNKSAISYIGRYKEFKSKVRLEASENTGHKVVIRLDIENYYDNISIYTLLTRIRECMKYSVMSNLRFDPSTSEQLVFFFDWISRGKGGIPQFDNDLISGFIGYLYLTFADLSIDETIAKQSDFVKGWQIIRYVDDTFISLTFREEVPTVDRETITESLMSRIADRLHADFSLKLNQKTRMYWLDNETHRVQLLRDLKRVSIADYSSDESKETPQEKVDNLFKEIEKLKGANNEIWLKYDEEVNEDILKNIYERPVAQLLLKPENQEKIQAVFQDFNYELVKVKPREITAVIARHPDVSNRFREFLTQKTDLSTRDEDLILRFLCQTEFTDSDLLNRLREGTLQDIIAAYCEAKLHTDTPGYFNVSSQQALAIAHPHIVEQIRLRIQYERSGVYAIALNHLLNEIHAICRELDEKNDAEYKADDAVNYLRTRATPRLVTNGIRKLFDLRNWTPVSHPRAARSQIIGVTEPEYLLHRDHVDKCLKHIL